MIGDVTCGYRHLHSAAGVVIACERGLDHGGYHEGHDEHGTEWQWWGNEQDTGYPLPQWARERAEEALNDYGNENGWSKMRPDEMVGIVLRAIGDRGESRNVITLERAEENRQPGRRGGYTFNALLADDYDGPSMTIACVRLGEHAHIDWETGRQVPSPAATRRPTLHRSGSGHLIMKWMDWLLLRELLAQVRWTRIAEVENPNDGQLEHHARPHEPGSQELQAVIQRHADALNAAEQYILATPIAEGQRAVLGAIRELRTGRPVRSPQ